MIIVGVGGGIAAYKACALVRHFTERGHEVRVIPTESALKFVGAATLEALTAAAFGQRRKMLRSSLKALGGAALVLAADVAVREITTRSGDLRAAGLRTEQIGRLLGGEVLGVDVEVGLEPVAGREDDGAADRVVRGGELGGGGVADHRQALEVFERGGALVGGQADEHAG